MTGLERGEVVLVLFPNSDLVSFTRRHALVVQAKVPSLRSDKLSERSRNP